MSWKSKKQNVVVGPSTKAKNQDMTLATCEFVWLKQLPKELRIRDLGPMQLICDNQEALHIASNLVFHEQTKHIEINYHFMRQKLISREISTPFVHSNNQLADLLKKGPQLDYIYTKLGTYDVYAPT